MLSVADAVEVYVFHAEEQRRERRCEALRLSATIRCAPDEIDPGAFCDLWGRPLPGTVGEKRLRVPRLRGKSVARHMRYRAKKGNPISEEKAAEEMRLDTVHYAISPSWLSPALQAMMINTYEVAT